MKYFEHEVLNYDLSEKGQYEAMKKAVAEYGVVGFEVVSVVSQGQYNYETVIFLKRESVLNQNVEAA